MDFQKYDIKEKKKKEKTKSQELLKKTQNIYIYGVCFKNLKIKNVKIKRKEEKDLHNNLNKKQ